MRDREMILEDESNESHKVQTVKLTLINTGIFKFIYVTNTPHGSVCGTINCAIHTPYLGRK